MNERQSHPPGLSSSGREKAGEEVVSVEELTRWFGETAAVRGLDFSVRKGEMFYVVGPDGAGKSTLIRLLSGILKPSSGSGRILGFNLIAEHDEIKKHIGYLSQKFTLYGDLTVDENIEFFAEIHGVHDYEDRRQELLAFTRLEPFRRRLAENLSGGMKQKLALACTLVHTPDLLLLDEPTTGVDPVSRRDFWKILFGLLQKGMTIIVTTPYLDEAERGSRVALMDKGRFIVVDEPAVLKSRMRGQVVELVCDDNRKASSVLKDFPGSTDVQTFGDRLNVVVDDVGRAMLEIERKLGESNLKILDWRPVPPSLEHVFIALTSEAGGENGRA
jgi:ABC-2 type transport system ATP-binding protein